MTILSSGWQRHVQALLGYAAVAIAFSWPLPAHLFTHLTGTSSGDTGVYVWNQWVFHHELVDHRGSPFFTDAIFSLTTPVSLALHNYTVFQNLVALPFIDWLGPIATFNLVYLLMMIVSGYATFLLARRVTRSDVESWLGGFLFAWSPILVTRGGGHFSLVAAAPLAVFLLLLLRTLERQRMRDGIALGATLWWAASSDVYYAVYCVLLAVVFVLWRTLTITPGGFSRSTVRRIVDASMAAVAILAISILITGGWTLTLVDATISMRSLYTPMLVLTLLAAVRVALSYRLRLARPERGRAYGFLRIAIVAALVSAVLVSPVLYAAGAQIVEEGFAREPIFWRSSPRGVDVAALVLPNPNHPLAPDAIRAWLSPRPDAYFENVASLTFTALMVIVLSRRVGWRLSGPWIAIALTFGALALGPFVHISGVNTQIPGPWAFLRYVPVIGLARTPGRFSVVLMLAVSILFASALQSLAAHRPQRRRALILGVAAALVFELLPMPRPLYSATIPEIYRQVADAPSNTQLLELPLGVRDGTSSVGDFSAQSQFFQTMHERRLIGGYLSRVSPRRIEAVRNDPVVDSLIALSEAAPVDDSRRQRLTDDGRAFIRRANIAFVVVDRTRTPAALRDLAIRAFALEPVGTDGIFELYRPRR